MAIFTRISEPSEVARVKALAKGRSTRLNSRMREYEEMILELTPGEAGEFEPDENETARGIALRVSRAAQRLQIQVSTWVANGIVYVTRQFDYSAVESADETVKQRKGRKSKTQVVEQAAI